MEEGERENERKKERGREGGREREREEREEKEENVRIRRKVELERETGDLFMEFSEFTIFA